MLNPGAPRLAQVAPIHRRGVQSPGAGGGRCSTCRFGLVWTCGPFPFPPLLFHRSRVAANPGACPSAAHICTMPPLAWWRC